MTPAVAPLGYPAESAALAVTAWAEVTGSGNCRCSARVPVTDSGASAAASSTPAKSEPTRARTGQHHSHR